MHYFRYIIILALMATFLSTCNNNEIKTPNIKSIDNNTSCASVNLHITEQAEALYKSTMQHCGNTFAVYTAGTDSMQQVNAPVTFKGLVIKLQEEWAISSQDLSHPVMKFLIELYSKSPLHFKNEVIQQRNLKSYYLAYSLLTGELNTRIMSDILNKTLGDDFSLYLDNPDLTVEWSDDSKILILKLKDDIFKTIKIKQKIPRHIQYYQKVKTVTLSSDEIKALETKYYGNVRLMDNAIGKIEQLFIFYNRYLPYKTLLSMCRSIDAHVNIVTLPQSRLMHCVTRYTQALDQGKLDKHCLKEIIEHNVHHSSRYKLRIESMCNEDGEKLINENRESYLQKWKDLKNNIFTEEINGHNQNLKKQLESDGLNSKKFTIISSQHLESQWARDYFLLGYSKNDKPLFFSSSIQLIKRNQTLAEQLTHEKKLKNNWGIKDIHLPFEGGDIRAVGNYIFMGENTFELGIDNIADIITSQGKALVGSNLLMSTNRNEIALAIKSEYESLFGRTFTLVGEGDTFPQPMMHLDMFLTFLPNPGKIPLVVVADMHETLALLEGLSDEEIARIERSMLNASLHPDELNYSSPFWLYRGLFMRHDFISIILHGGLSRYITTYQKSKKRNELQQRLDAVATWFKEKGHTVVRAPTAAPRLGIINYWSQHNAKSFRGTAIFKTARDNAHRLYTNGLIEMYVDSKNNLHRTVYLPYYGISPIEKKLVEIYNNLGYHVVFIPFMWEPANGRGALDCLTTEVRSPFKIKKAENPK